MLKVKVVDLVIGHSLLEQLVYPSPNGGGQDPDPDFSKKAQMMDLKARFAFES